VRGPPAAAASRGFCGHWRKRFVVNDDATTVVISLPDAEATRNLGALLAKGCPPGTIILLRGPLGSGKTTFADGFTQELGGGRATSPTFVIAHAHEKGRVPLWHLDLYRMEDERQVADLDLSQYIADTAITLCEWPERASGVWPQDTLVIEFSVEGRGRKADLRAAGPRSQALVGAVKLRGHES
jgi:tRNA threonylcarbamoyladenosine biosynthesis protein TsaE